MNELGLMQHKRNSYLYRSGYDFSMHTSFCVPSFVLSQKYAVVFAEGRGGFFLNGKTYSEKIRMWGVEEFSNIPKKKLKEIL